DAAATPVAETAEPAAKKAKEPAKRERPERKPADRSRAATRRRHPPRRAPLPAAKRELVISIDVGEQRVAVLEDGRVAEVYLERPERRAIAGNIQQGIVDDAPPGIEAGVAHD